MNTRQYQAPSHRVLRLPSFLISIIGLLLIVIVGVGLIRSRDHSSAKIGERVPASIVSNLTHIARPVWQRVGLVGARQGILIRSKSSPTFFYAGAEGCPYCAAERWAIVVALARFGRFSGLTLMESNPTIEDPNTPTLSFLHAHYHSRYLRANLIELKGRQFSHSRGFYPDLVTPSATESREMSRYDSPPYVPRGYSGSIPFILIGGRYLWIGSAYEPTMLDGQTWLTISQAIHSGRGAMAQQVLANANAMTSAICAVDGGRPAGICHTVGTTVPARALQ